MLQNICKCCSTFANVAWTFRAPKMKRFKKLLYLNCAHTQNTCCYYFLSNVAKSCSTAKRIILNKCSAKSSQLKILPSKCTTKQANDFVSAHNDCACEWVNWRRRSSTACWHVELHLRTTVVALVLFVLSTVSDTINGYLLCVAFMCCERCTESSSSNLAAEKGRKK